MAKTWYYMWRNAHFGPRDEAANPRKPEWRRFRSARILSAEELAPPPPPANFTTLLIACVANPARIVKDVWRRALTKTASFTRFGAWFCSTRTILLVGVCVAGCNSARSQEDEVPACNDPDVQHMLLEPFQNLQQRLKDVMADLEKKNSASQTQNRAKTNIDQTYEELERHLKEDLIHLSGIHQISYDQVNHVRKCGASFAEDTKPLRQAVATWAQAYGVGYFEQDRLKGVCFESYKYSIQNTEDNPPQTLVQWGCDGADPDE